ACAADPDYLARYDAVMARLHGENGRSTWYGTEYPAHGARPIAYFCAEFGLHNSVPIYSGGLGVLAGDHCKAASDLGVPLLGVGRSSRKAYCAQGRRRPGWQEAGDTSSTSGLTPPEQLHAAGGEPWLPTVEAPGRTVHVGAWKLQVGN